MGRPVVRLHRTSRSPGRRCSATSHLRARPRPSSPLPVQPTHQPARPPTSPRPWPRPRPRPQTQLRPTLPARVVLPAVAPPAPPALPALRKKRKTTHDAGAAGAALNSDSDEEADPRFEPERRGVFAPVLLHTGRRRRGSRVSYAEGDGEDDGEEEQESDDEMVGEDGEEEGEEDGEEDGEVEEEIVGEEDGVEERWVRAMGVVRAVRTRMRSTAGMVRAKRPAERSRRASRRHVAATSLW